MPQTNLKSPAHTLGLELDVSQSGAVHLTRHGRSIILTPQNLHDLNHPDPIHQRFIQTAALTGIRLALDQLEITRQKADLTKHPTQPTAPIRAGGPQPKVVRYHEVASVYGDRLLRLFPSLALDWCEAITHQKLYRLPWPQNSSAQSGLEITFAEESGRTLDLLTHDQAAANPDPDKLLRDARAALFYDSYRVRPSQKLTFDTGTINIIRTTEGLGASRAIILPEFDWNASQDHGFLAIPDRDTLLIAHPSSPDDPQSRAQLHTEFQTLIQRLLHQTIFPLSNATFDLNIDQTKPHPTQPTTPLPATNYPQPPTNLTSQPACKNTPP